MFQPGRALAVNVAREIIDKISDPDLRRQAEQSISMTPDIVTCVNVWHKIYGPRRLHPSEAKDDFSHITKERLAMRFGLIVEEFTELCKAMDIAPILEFQYMDEEGTWKTTEDLVEAIMETEARDLPNVADACEDLKYVITGFELEVGIDPHAVLREVQASNLTKMGADGRPILREDGKVLKGPNYIQADPQLALQAHGLNVGYSAPIMSTRELE
jgi:predicted HAD superfamily Cof-like phosphohydrolase